MIHEGGVLHHHSLHSKNMILSRVARLARLYSCSYTDAEDVSQSNSIPSHSDDMMTELEFLQNH